MSSTSETSYRRRIGVIRPVEIAGIIISFFLSSFNFFNGMFAWNDFSYAVDPVRMQMAMNYTLMKQEPTLDIAVKFYNEGNRPVLVDATDFFIMGWGSSEHEPFRDIDCRNGIATDRSRQIYLYEGKDVELKDRPRSWVADPYGDRNAAARLVPAESITLVESRYDPFSRLDKSVGSFVGFLCMRVTLSGIKGQSTIDFRALARIRAIGGIVASISFDGVEPTKDPRKLLTLF